ncbi:MarR family winged helix-turn-helix transcriptional regulator [Shimia aestuarii]|uniref:DNA-binding transcriptional regulator, MarR family n=1 Tax=Shimia aestuarii TaxID=254406 RepID=A0A1I4LBM2_9RHOB|nr:MarR family transcriptional regulator [Shimia aestuarii]SFL88269.1 DNA-binding transcriptional regulator, MarR family [Shimia aestuarii]
MAKRQVREEAEPVAVSDAALTRFLGYHLKRAQTVLMGDMNAAIAPLGLRMITYSALAMVAENPGLRQSHLADALSIERPNLVVILDDLEERGLISRDRVPTDRRAYALMPTLAGRKLYEEATAAVAAHEARMLAGVSAEDRAAVLRVLGAIRHGKGGEEHG